jgi:hypothetical protein
MDSRTNDAQVDCRAGRDRMERSMASAEEHGDVQQFADRFRSLRTAHGETWLLPLPQLERPTFSDAGNRWRLEMLRR